MADDSSIVTSNNYEELQLQKLKNEIRLQELDKDLKQKELKKRTIFEPTAVTILVALIGLSGAAITNFWQRNSQLEIEEKKFQYSVYEKALEARDNLTAARVLDFYIKAGLLPGAEGKFTKLIEQGKADEIPTYGDIYHDVPVPGIDKSESLTLSNYFIKGKGTEYHLSYNAKQRLNSSELNMIVLHSSWGGNLKGITKWLTDTTKTIGKSSAHVIIDTNGRIIQLVPFNFISYHADGYNNSSIGIEFINNGQNKYPEAQVEAGLTICRLLIKEYHITKIVGHSEISKFKIDPGVLFPINKFKSLVESPKP
jgi:hypothetical protein